ncbi:MAG: ATP synthase F0 subunit B [Minisyncoccia bacterium]
MGELISTFGLNWGLLIIQMVNFGVLLVALKYFLFKPVMGMLEERKQKIAQGIADAEAAAKKNADAEIERKAVIAEASLTGEQIVAKAALRAEEKGALIVTDAEKRAQSLTNDAALRAQETKDKALRESREEIAKAAILVAEKVLRGEKESVKSVTK